MSKVRGWSSLKVTESVSDGGDDEDSELSGEVPKNLPYSLERSSGSKVTTDPRARVGKSCFRGYVVSNCAVE